MARVNHKDRVLAADIRSRPKHSMHIGQAATKRGAVAARGRTLEPNRPYLIGHHRHGSTAVEVHLDTLVLGTMLPATGRRGPRGSLGPPSGLFHPPQSPPPGALSSCLLSLSMLDFYSGPYYGIRLWRIRSLVPLGPLGC